MPYRRPSVPPGKPWARFLERVQRERDWSRTRLFEEVRESVGWSPKSRASFYPILTGERDPKPEEAVGIREALGEGPSEADYELAKVGAGSDGPAPDLASALQAVAAAIQRSNDLQAQTAMLLERLVAKVGSLEDIQSAQTQAIARLQASPPLIPAHGQPSNTPAQ